MFAAIDTGRQTAFVMGTVSGCGVEQDLEFGAGAAWQEGAKNPSFGSWGRGEAADKAAILTRLSLDKSLEVKDGVLL